MNSKRKKIIGWTIGLTLFGIGCAANGPAEQAAAAGTHTATKITAPAWAPSEYEPCDTEDSTRCYWDASERGNGTGTDFWVDADGDIHNR